MKATEKLTGKQVLNMIEAKVQRSVEDRNAADFATKFGIRSGVIEAMLNILICDNPTEAAKILHLADVKYILTKYVNENDMDGEMVGEWMSEQICDEYLKHYEKTDSGYIYKKSIKVTEL